MKYSTLLDLFDLGLVIELDELDADDSADELDDIVECVALVNVGVSVGKEFTTDDKVFNGGGARKGGTA